MTFQGGNGNATKTDYTFLYPRSYITLETCAPMMMLHAMAVTLSPLALTVLLTLSGYITVHTTLMLALVVATATRDTHAILLIVLTMTIAIFSTTLPSLVTIVACTLPSIATTCVLLGGGYQTLLALLISIVTGIFTLATAMLSTDCTPHALAYLMLAAGSMSYALILGGIHRGDAMLTTATLVLAKIILLVVFALANTSECSPVMLASPSALLLCAILYAPVDVLTSLLIGSTAATAWRILMLPDTAVSTEVEMICAYLVITVLVMTLLYTPPTAQAIGLRLLTILT